MSVAKGECSIKGVMMAKEIKLSRLLCVNAMSILGEGTV